MTEHNPNNLTPDLPGEGLDAPLFDAEDRAVDARLAALIGASVDASLPDGLGDRVFAASKEHLPAPVPLTFAEPAHRWSLRVIAGRIGMAACFMLVCTVLVWALNPGSNNPTGPMVADSGGSPDVSTPVRDGGSSEAIEVPVTFAIQPVVVPTALDQQVLNSTGDSFHETDRLLGLTDLGYDSLIGDMSQLLGSISGQEM